MGLVKGACIFVVADDGVPVPNKYPLFSGTGLVGLSYHLFEHSKFTLSLGGVFNTAMTAHLRLAYLF